jgi:hypothetical protein
MSGYPFGFWSSFRMLGLVDRPPAQPLQGSVESVLLWAHVCVLRLSRRCGSDTKQIERTRTARERGAYDRLRGSLQIETKTRGLRVET